MPPPASQPASSRVSLPRLAAVLVGLAALAYALVTSRPPPPAPRCPPLHAHCDTSAHEGCDTDLSVDPAHCGACGVACPAGASCKEGRCTTPVREIAVGRRHVCAATASGEVRCWGDGVDFQLGDGAREPSSVPIPVPGLDDVVSLSAAQDGTCALRRDGAVVCWGTHEAWPRPLPTPRPVAGLPPATRLSVSVHHACAVTRTGELWCWGAQMGPGDVRSSFKPSPAPGVEGVLAVASGESNDCVVETSGRVRCWETALYGRPAREVAGVTDAIDVGTGDDTGCAVTGGGRLLCWRQYRGPESEKYRASPGPVPSARSLAMAREHACAILDDGSARCWGNDSSGQLGGGGNPAEPAEDGGAHVAEVAGLADVRRVAAGGETSCAARADGAVACWGEGRYGQLGPAAQGVFHEAVRVPGLPTITALAADWHETCAVTAERTLRCWGGTDLLGFPEIARPRTEPVSGVQSLVMASPHVCVVRTDGTIACRASRGGRDKNTAWAEFPLVSGVVSLSIVVGTRESTGYALLRSGAVVAVSLRGEGKPVALEGLRGVRALGAGEQACALTADRGALCWSHAEIEAGLAAGKATLRPRLLAAPELDGARQLGDGHAITAAGRLVGWGARLHDGALATFDVGFPGAQEKDRFAQSQRTLCVLAEGKVVCRGELSADPVSGLSGVVGLAVGDGHACAVGKSGEVWCWGDNAWGAVGQDRPTGSATPVTLSWGIARPSRPAPAPTPEAPLFLRRRLVCGTSEGVDACVYLGCAGMDCLNALLAEKDPVRVRYMRRLSDAAARLAQESLARGEDPGGVAHAEMAMSCARSGPCSRKDENGNEMDDGYACLTAAEMALQNGDAAASRAAHARACRCDPVRAQIPVMGGVLACDGPHAPVSRGKPMPVEDAEDVRACAECDPEAGPPACVREIARLRTRDAEQARYVEEVRVPLCREE